MKLSADQRATLKWFLHDPNPEDEFLRDSINEIREFKLRGEESQRRDRAVALFYHRVRMQKVFAAICEENDL